jgi:glycosyltransferase involved in cell wall biosynthesis
MPGISLLIPTYNRDRYLREAIKSLNALEIPSGVDVELLVINNNCTDSTESVVREEAASHKLPIRHILETQQGLCFGRNRGIAEARYEHLGFLDDDILVSPQWVSSYFKAIQEFKADAVVGPVFPIFEYSQPEFIHGRALAIISSRYSRKGDDAVLLHESTAHELPGCNFGVTRKMAMQLNGFNTELDRIGKKLLAGGDSDFGRRLVVSGGRTAYHPGCWIKHVMAEEKLSKAYLRKRAYGLGMTATRLSNRPLRFYSKMRHGYGALRLSIGVLWSYLTGDPEAFNRELHAREAWGHLR